MPRLRPATPDDAELLVTLIHELADYERLAHEARPSAEALRRHLAADAAPGCGAFIAEDDDGDALGFALFYWAYSTFLTNWGAYLEDLYVRPSHRSRGVGYALLRRVAEEAVARGAERMEWSVLTWNEPALTFYERLGARRMDDWRTMRLAGDALQTLGTDGGA